MLWLVLLATPYTFYLFTMGRTARRPNGASESSEHPTGSYNLSRRWPNYLGLQITQYAFVLPTPYRPLTSLQLAPGEADAELARLNRSGYVRTVMSNDIDCLIFGALQVIKL